MRKLSILSAAALLVLTAATSFGGVYRWVDANGVVHYSDTPPPTGAEQFDIETSPTDSAAVARHKRTQAKLKKFDQQRKAEAEATSKTAKQQKAAQAACAKAKKRVASLAGARRVKSTGKEGKVTWLSGKDLVDYRRAAKERAAKLCSGA